MNYERGVMMNADGSSRKMTKREIIRFKKSLIKSMLKDVSNA